MAKLEPMSLVMPGEERAALILAYDEVKNLRTALAESEARVRELEAALAEESGRGCPSGIPGDRSPPGRART